MTKRWYNCWLKHEWGKWEEVALLAFPTPFSEPRRVSGQERKCLLCGRTKIAEV